jgi:signal transduction histidine kinase
VAVAIKEDIGKVSVTVSNTGSEISDENMKKIWNKFYQADESHSAEGNGVGLAIVKRVVDLHGGAISVKSGEGVTSFTVDLPVD